MNKYIQTNFLTLQEVESLIAFIKEQHNIDYSVHIESLKNSSSFRITFKEV